MSADLLRQLLALDLSTEQALAVMDIIENRDGDRKEKARARWHKWNDKRLPNVSKREPTLANVSSPTHASASPAPDLENKQTNKQESKKDIAPLALEFDETFWPAYPLKRGKADALKAFLAARKRASLEIIMAGVRRYAAERAGEDSKFTKHAQGWLSGDHWTDEPAPLRIVRQAHSPPETVGSLSRKQLFGPRNEIDVTDYSERRVEASGPGRLEAGSGPARSFAITGDILGRI